MGIRRVIFLGVFLINWPLLAQLSYQKTDQLDVVKVDSQSVDQVYSLSSNQLISALVIKSKNERRFELLLGQDIVTIPLDHDAPDFTYFLSLQSPTNNIKLTSSDTSPFEVYLIKSGEVPRASNQLRPERIEECSDHPITIPQSDWRSGLPAPSYTRVFHEVFHNVVHHSAGSNSNTNYTQVVRDIYIYHTQVNGWSDIGYNYLIAQDGSIFAGRDPDTGSQDEVMGAHFCGANSGTLGICLLGNYETADPTSAAWSSLKSLLTYEMLSQALTPFDNNSHSLGRLGAIIGHRDGCATLCPGENIYSMLETLEVEVTEEMELCGELEPIAFTADTTLAKVNELVNFQAFGNYQEFSWMFEGGLPNTFTGESLFVRYPAPGNYDVTLIGKRGTSYDTLYRDDFMKASYLLDKPLVYPNPISRSELLKVDFGEDISELVIHDVHGRLVNQWVNEVYPLSGLKPGMYFLSISAGANVYLEKLIIR